MRDGTGNTKAEQAPPRDCIGRLTLCLMWNGRNAKDIVLALHGGYQQLEKVNIHLTNVAGDVVVELKPPASLDGAERVEEHPQRREVDEHNPTSCLQFIADYTKFEQLQMIRIIRIVVLAHHLRTAILLHKDPNK